MSSSVSLAYWSVHFEEVGLEVHLKEVTANTLDGVIEGQNVNAFTVIDAWARVDVHEIAKLDTQIVARNLVHLDLAFLNVIGGQADGDGVATLLATTGAINAWFENENIGIHTER